MVDGVPNVREIFDDARVTQKLAPLASRAAPRVADENRTGWRDSRPLEAPAGINHVDRLCEAADARDRAQLIADEARRLAKK